VAVTRAKIRLHVIGNFAQWSEKPFFSVAAARLGPLLNVDEFEGRLAMETGQNRISALPASAVPAPRQTTLGFGQPRTWRLPPNTARKPPVS
jgi:hypothetical protein